MFVRRLFVVGALMAPLLLIHSTVAFGQDPNDDELSERELREIEASLAADQQAVEQARPAAPTASTLNPDISLVLDTAFAWFTADEPLQGGAHDPLGNGFTFQQLELNLAKAVDPYFRLDAFLVLTTEGVEVEEAFATTLALPANLQARAGQFLSRFGRLNAMHPHAWDFVDQPFVNGRMLGGEGQRGTGLELSWLTPLPWYVELVASSSNPGNLFGHGHEEEEAAGEEPAHLDSPLDMQHVVALEQFFELGPNWSLLWGLSGAATRDEYLVGSDLYLKYRPITRASDTLVALQSEWMMRWREDAAGERHRDFGGYTQLVWRFDRRWGTGARYEYGSDDPLDAIASDDRHRVSAQATFWPTEFSRLRLQGAMDYPRWQDDPDFSVMLAGEFIIGAHGAHKF